MLGLDGLELAPCVRPRENWQFDSITVATRALLNIPVACFRFVHRARSIVSHLSVFFPRRP